MKRRSFLKFFGGAAAAPAVVNPSVVLNPITGGLVAGRLVPDFEENISGMSPILEGSDKMSRFLKLKSVLLGKEEWKEEPYSLFDRRRHMAEIRINSLVSCSTSAKMTMLSRELRELRKQESRAYNIREYLKLKKELFG